LARCYRPRNGLPTLGAACWPNCDNAMASLPQSQGPGALLAVTSCPSFLSSHQQLTVVHLCIAWVTLRCCVFSQSGTVKTIVFFLPSCNRKAAGAAGLWCSAAREASWPCLSTDYRSRRLSTGPQLSFFLNKSPQLSCLYTVRGARPAGRWRFRELSGRAFRKLQRSLAAAGVV
jgi:hypothetical protein